MSDVSIFVALQVDRSCLHDAHVIVWVFFIWYTINNILRRRDGSTHSRWGQRKSQDEHLRHFCSISQFEKSITVLLGVKMFA